MFVVLLTFVDRVDYSATDPPEVEQGRYEAVSSPCKENCQSNVFSDVFTGTMAIFRAFLSFTSVFCLHMNL